MISFCIFFYFEYFPLKLNLPNPEKKLNKYEKEEKPFPEPVKNFYLSYLFYILIFQFFTPLKYTIYFGSTYFLFLYCIIFFI